MLSQRGKSLQQLQDEETALRAERRRHMIEANDRFARVLAHESRRADSDVDSKPLRRITRAEEEVTDRETIRLQGVLTAAGLSLSLDETRALSPAQKQIIEQVGELLKSGWFTKDPAPEPAKTDNDENDDGAEEVAAEASLFLGVTIAAHHVRRSWAANERLRAMESDSVKKRQAKRNVFIQRP